MGNGAGSSSSSNQVSSKAAWQNTKGPLLIPDHCLLLSATVYLALQQSTTVCGHVFLGSLFEVAPDTDFI